MTCANCDQPIVTVTIGGVTVWAHDRDDSVVLYMTSPNGPRMCGLGNGEMARP